MCGHLRGYRLLISEVRPRGTGAGTDDFIEIYNPLAVAVVLPNDIEILVRSDAQASYVTRWASGGQTIPAHGHYLIAGGGYVGAATPNFALSSGTGLVPDKGSVVLKRGAGVIDAVCWGCGAFSFDATYTCEGTPINFPGCTSNNSDRSLERKPGAALGNGSDTNDNSADFAVATPSSPQNLTSPTAP